MKNDIAISTRHVNKRFKIYFDKGSTAKERLIFRGRGRYEERVVLKDVNVEIKKGESVGLIGRNGSGKSTLLKILSRIMYPNSGDVSVNGRVSSLLELGAGFHPDMSGRENIYTNATIFGLSRREIERRLDRIIAYSELEDFIDNPVRTYSSGMYMRLAFSVAINVDADILLIDEILAVGDANFQRKCFNTLRNIKNNGTTILIVSHSLGQIEQFCDRSIWLADGVIRLDGEPRSVHFQYLDFMNDRALHEQPQQPEQPQPEVEPEEEASAQQPEEEKTRFGSGEYSVEAVRLTDASGALCSAFKTGSGLNIEIDYRLHGSARADDIVVGVGIFRNDGVHCYGTNTFIDHGRALSLADSGTIVFRAPSSLLLNGEYWLDVAIESTNGFPYDYWKQALYFQAISDLNDIGVGRIEHVWELDGKRL